MRKDTVGCFHLVRMIKAACHVVTEILEVLASGGKDFLRSQKEHLEAKLLIPSKTEPSVYLSIDLI